MADRREDILQGLKDQALEHIPGLPEARDYQAALDRATRLASGLHGGWGMFRRESRERLAEYIFQDILARARDLDIHVALLLIQEDLKDVSRTPSED